MSQGIRQPPRRHSNLRILVFKVAEVLARWAGGRRFYRRFFLAKGRFDLRREVLLVPGRCLQSGASDPKGEQVRELTIIQLSDIHAGAFLRGGDLADVVQAINDLDPDLVVFTGDLISRSADEAMLVLPDLARIKARYGFFAVFGNHDYRQRREGEIAAAYGERGIRFLRNESVRPLGPDSALVLLGVEDLEEAKNLDLDAARAELRPGDFEVVLSHNPSGARALLGPNTGLVLSGHTHGKQIDLPILRGLGPPHPGDRVEIDGRPCITTHGIGAIGVPFRFDARPEVVVIQLQSQEELS